jgi:hypothetical protein
MSESERLPSRQLPPKPNIEQLKNQARDLLNAHRSGAAEVCTRFRASLTRLSEASEQSILQAKITLRDAQSVIAREYGFSSWAKLKGHVEELQALPDAKDRILQALSEQPEVVGKALRAIQGDPRQIGPLLIALGQETAAEMMRWLGDSGIEMVTQAIAGLERVTPEEQSRALEAFAQRLRRGEPEDQDSVESEYKDFLQGALELAVGRPRAIEYLDQQGVPANTDSKPRLTKQYLTMKRGLGKRLRNTSASSTDLDGIRALMVDLAQVVRAEGILALEEFFSDPSQIDELLCTGMQLAIDGTEPEQLTEMLENRKNARVHRVETRCDMMITGIVAIRQDVPWRVVDQKLASFYKA